jgi:hypothetical protein
VKNMLSDTTLAWKSTNLCQNDARNSRCRIWSAE